MELKTTLTPKEEGDVLAWVNLYRAHPELIGVKNTAWPPNGQTRIVLDSCTKERFDEISAQFPVAGPGPTPPPAGGPFADLRWRLANRGSWAAFGAPFFVEGNALKEAYPALATAVSQLNNYYGPGGWGNVNGRRTGNSFEYVDLKTGALVPDIDGAADKMILANSVSEDNPKGVPPPALSIPD